MSFGSRLKELREKHNMTQQELAQRINLSKASVSKYEADYIEPNLTTLLMISKLFNISTDYLLEHNIGSVISEKQRRLVDICADLNEEEFKKVLEYIDFIKSKRK